MDPLHVTGADVTLKRLRADATNWRLGLVRLLVAGIAVVITFTVVPGLTFTTWHWGEFWIVAIAYGLINALVKPLLQFFALRYLVATYGLVIVLINAFLLWLLTSILDQWFEVRGLVPLLIGGLIVGVRGLVFDAVLGTTRPIVDTHGGFDRGAGAAL